MILILLRHGLTEANEKRLYCGAADPGLSAAGKDALLRLQKAGTLPDVTGMRIVTSGMRRCEETLQLLYGDVAHSTDPAFREMDFGAFELHSYEQLKTDPAYCAWISGDNERNVAPGGESGRCMTQRVLRGLRLLKQENRDTLLVTHGGVIAAIMTQLFPAEKKNRYDWQPAPGGGYRIDTLAGTYTAF